MIPLKNVEQMRALVGDVFREALSENNTVLKKDISSTVTADVVHEMDFLLQAKERQQEEHFRRLDSLIRQQQATRKESAKERSLHRRLCCSCSSFPKCLYCCRSSFPKRVYCGIHARRTVPMGPFLCFAMMISAIFLSSVSGL